MFGDNDLFEDIAERLLEMYDLEDILEMNNLTPEEALAILIEGGHLAYPRFVFEELETDEDGETE